MSPTRFAPIECCLMIVAAPRRAHSRFTILAGIATVPVVALVADILHGESLLRPNAHLLRYCRLQNLSGDPTAD
jgi:hypothetical protein